MRLKRKRPPLQRGPQKSKQLTSEFYHKSSFKNKFKSKRLKENKPIAFPDPLSFYQKEFPEIERKGEWVKVHCCFHEDKNPSLSVNLVHGGFKCWACGTSGGGIVTFYRRRYGLSYSEIIKRLGVEYE